MTPLRHIAIGALLLCSVAASAAGTPAPGYPISQVPFTAVKVDDSFWTPRLRASRDVTIPLAFSKCESTGRYDNFVRAAHPSDTIRIGGFPFDDTDVYKTSRAPPTSSRPFPTLVSKPISTACSPSWRPPRNPTATSTQPAR